MLRDGSLLFKKDGCVQSAWAFPKKDETGKRTGVLDLGPFLVYFPEKKRFTWAKIDRPYAAPNPATVLEVTFASGDKVTIHSDARVYARMMGVDGPVRPVRLAHAIDASPIEAYRVKVKTEGKPDGSGWEFVAVKDRVVSVKERKEKNVEVQVAWYRTPLSCAYLVSDTLLVR